MYCWQILVSQLCVGVKCVVLAKTQPLLSRKVFVSVAGGGFVALCGRGLRRHLPSLVCAVPFLNVGLI